MNETKGAVQARRLNSKEVVFSPGSGTEFTMSNECFNLFCESWMDQILKKAGPIKLGPHPEDAMTFTVKFDEDNDPIFEFDLPELFVRFGMFRDVALRVGHSIRTLKAQS